MTFQERRIAAADLDRFCGAERWAHLALSVISAGGLLVLAAVLLVRNPDWKTAVIMFGPAGIIVFSQGRVLTIWTQIANILMGTYK